MRQSKKDRNDGQRVEAKILQEITYIVNIKKKNNKQKFCYLKQ